MIARVQGILVHKSAHYVIVDAQGIGYRVFVPLTTFYVLPEAGQAVTLNIHTHVKQDGINLFGFYTAPERDIFQLMITVSGIGPKLAMNILSGISAGELVSAVSQGNLDRLMSIPGVGRKMAQRLVLELKDKILRLGLEATVAEDGGMKRGEDRVKDDALSALINLGYREQAAAKALEKVIKAAPESLSLDVLLKKALQILAG